LRTLALGIRHRERILIPLLPVDPGDSPSKRASPARDRPAGGRPTQNGADDIRYAPCDSQVRGPRGAVAGERSQEHRPDFPSDPRNVLATAGARSGPLHIQQSRLLTMAQIAQRARRRPAGGVPAFAGTPLLVVPLWWAVLAFGVQPLWIAVSRWQLHRTE